MYTFFISALLFFSFALGYVKVAGTLSDRQHFFLLSTSVCGIHRREKDMFVSFVFASIQVVGIWFYVCFVVYFVLMTCFLFPL